MSQVFNLQARLHQSRVLMNWLAQNPKAVERAGVQPVQANLNRDNLSAAELVRLGVFGTGPAFAGVHVNDSTAMLVGTVFACLSKLGGAISQLPVHQYRLNAEGDRERAPLSPLWWLLNESPDPAWTASSWKDWIVRCVALRGDQHTEILRKGPVVSGFRVHHPDDCQARRVDGRLRYDVYDHDLGRARGVDQDDMLHFAGFGFDGVKSISAIQWCARNAIGNAIAAARYMGKTMGEGGMPRIALHYPNKVSPESAQNLRDSFVSIYGVGDGQKLPLVLSEGAQAKELSIAPVDLELLASRRFDKTEICEVLGVPPILIGDSEKTSSWGTGIEQIILGWVLFSIKPMLCRWEEELNRKLFRRAGQFVEFELGGLLRGDSKAQAEAFRAALGGPGTGDGWMAVNQVRQLLNQPKLEGEQFNTPYRAPRDTSGAPAP